MRGGSGKNGEKERENSRVKFIYTKLSKERSKRVQDRIKSKGFLLEVWIFSKQLLIKVNIL